MRTLTLEDISPYLPYGVYFEGPHLIYSGNPPEPSHEEYGPILLTLENLQQFLKHQFPLDLRPLSDLTKEINHNGERFVPIERLKEWYNSQPDSYINKLGFVYWDGNFTLFGLEDDESYEVSMPYQMYQMLYSWHFDTNDLIGKGLALNMNGI